MQMCLRPPPHLAAQRDAAASSTAGSLTQQVFDTLQSPTHANLTRRQHTRLARAAASRPRRRIACSAGPTRAESPDRQQHTRAGPGSCAQRPGTAPGRTAQAAQCLGRAHGCSVCASLGQRRQVGVVAQHLAPGELLAACALWRPQQLDGHDPVAGQPAQRLRASRGAGRRGEGPPSGVAPERSAAAAPGSSVQAGRGAEACGRQRGERRAPARHAPASRGAAAASCRPRPPPAARAPPPPASPPLPRCRRCPAWAAPAAARPAGCQRCSGWPWAPAPPPPPRPC
jgi:hypothetical protein